MIYDTIRGTKGKKDVKKTAQMKLNFYLFIYFPFTKILFKKNFRSSNLMLSRYIGTDSSYLCIYSHEGCVS